MCWSVALPLAAREGGDSGLTLTQFCVPNLPKSSFLPHFGRCCDRMIGTVGSLGLRKGDSCAFQS